MVQQTRPTLETFKLIFRHWFDEFLRLYPEYERARQTIEQMLGCGQSEQGYAQFICPHCNHKKVVAFSCKSSFCFRCGASHTIDWVRQMEALLFAGVTYRHVVMTVPEQLRHYFQQSPRLLGEMAKAAVGTLVAVISRAAGCQLRIGAVAVIQTAGRASNYNPHVHLLITSGGLDQSGKWQEVERVSFDYLHREWQRQLFEMLEEEVKDEGLKKLLQELKQQYGRGLVAYWEKRAVRAGKGLAQYLIKYVASPPIAVSRIIEYDGQEVEYFWQDHKSERPERARVTAVEFIRLLVQHILPKGFQRVRYLGLHAVCLRQKIAEQVRCAIGAVVQKAFFYGTAVMSKVGWRKKIKEKFGRDLLRCERCGCEMELWKIWIPGKGVVYDLLEDAPVWREGKTDSQVGNTTQLCFGF